MATSEKINFTKFADALDLLGFKYRIDHNYDLSSINLDDWVQTRETANYAPKDMVDRYVVQMANSVFPPIVVTRDHRGIDGRSRIAARRKRNENFCEAIILEESFEDADAKRQNEMRALGAMLNSVDGKELTKAEMRRAVRTMLDLNWLPEVIGKELGAPKTVINQVRREMAAEAKLTELGIEIQGNGKPKLDGPALRAIAGKEVASLNNEPLRGLVNLAMDAGLTSSEISTLGKELHDAGSDAAALQLLERQNDEMETRIRDKAMTGNGAPPPSRQLRQRLGWINAFAGEEQRLVETSPGAYETAETALGTAVDVLTATLRLQRERAQA